MAFRKPLSNLKTSAPLRSSDRRKLRQRVVQSFDLQNASESDPELVDLLVPEGIQSAKFSTHTHVPGIAYTSPDGDTLWFTMGKGSEDLIPTVYTLWKHPSLLPCLLTPAAVIPILEGGADLMIPGVFGIQCSHDPSSLRTDQLVAVSQYERLSIGAPIAIGRLAISGPDLHDFLNDLTDNDSSGTQTPTNPNASIFETTPKAKRKGKAVNILHIYGDKLWEMGSKRKPPESKPVVVGEKDNGEKVIKEVNVADSASAEEKADAIKDAKREVEEDGAHVVDMGTTQGTMMQDNSPPPSDTPNDPEPESDGISLSPGEVSDILQSSLLQAIQTTLSKLPASSFPLASTTLYSAHILPARPLHIPHPNPPPSTSDTPSKIPISSLTTPISIKHSSHKSLHIFLKLADKSSLLKLKEIKNKDPQILSVNPSHPAVLAHMKYWSVSDEESKKDRMEERENELKGRVMEIRIVEFWKPHQSSVQFFQQAGKDPTSLYTHSDLKSFLNSYIQTNQLINPRLQQFINIAQDPPLKSLFTPPRSKQQDSNTQPAAPDFMKRDEALEKLMEKMQPWHQMEFDGKEPITRKGALKPVSVTVKLRNGNKACTLITDFETYLLDANDLADDLRKRCASSTTVAPLPGKIASLEVMVQGKQMRVVTELLLAKGIPKKWIETNDLSHKKKK